MDLAFFVSTLALVPYFTSRAFIPLFATALVARFGAEWQVAANLLQVELLDSAPAWALSDQMLVALGGLAVAEFLATKSAAVRDLLIEFEAEAKALLVVAVVVVLAAAEVSGAPGTASTSDPRITAAGLGLAGFSPSYLWAAVVGAATWALGSIRRSIYLFLMEIDEDDDLGVQGLLSWLEDAIGFVGVLFALILPALAVAAAALAFLGLAFVRWLIRRREDERKVPCPTCGEPVPLCALACSACRAPFPEPRDVGLLGMIRQRPMVSPEHQVFRLRATKRCRSCGERLPNRDLDQSCTHCGLAAFDSAADLDAYLSRLRASLPRTLLVLFLLGLVPVLGLVPGIIYYRLTLIASLRAYLPRRSRFVGRWGVRLLNLIFILLQPVPILGAFTLPAMALSNFALYRRLVRRRAARALPATSRTPEMPVPG
jgi:predicted RNA-binding Zn-ribbon protein involved in translation (DUF1610 family)